MMKNSKAETTAMVNKTDNSVLKDLGAVIKWAPLSLFIHPKLC